MSKKEEQKEEKKAERKPRARVMDLIAFIALVASGLLLVAGPLLNILPDEMGGGIIYQALSMVAQYCLLAAVAIPAWMFVRNKRQGWKVFYIVFLIIYILGPVLGVTFGALGL